MRAKSAANSTKKPQKLYRALRFLFITVKMTPRILISLMISPSSVKLFADAGSKKPSFQAGGKTQDGFAPGLFAAFISWWQCWISPICSKRHSPFEERRK
jgi:hypothetical protein